MIQLDSYFATSLETPLMTTKVAPTTSYVSPWLAPVAYALGRFVVLPLYFEQILVTGQEHLPRSGPVILAPTHRSRWDAILVPATAGRCVTGRDLRFMVSANEASKGLQGWLIRRLGGFPVDTVRPSISTLRHGVELLQQGEVLVIFPEGGDLRENRSCRLNQLQPGLARIALQAESSQQHLGIKIVPISICYSDFSVPWRCRVKVSIGFPLAVADYSTGSLKQDARQLTSALAEKLKQLS